MILSSLKGINNFLGNKDGHRVRKFILNPKAELGPSEGLKDYVAILRKFIMLEKKITQNQVLLFNKKSHESFMSCSLKDNGKNEKEPT